jgi:hypothetical protein
MFEGSGHQLHLGTNKNPHNIIEPVVKDGRERLDMINDPIR